VDRKEKKVKYLALWEGCEQEDATWEPWENLKKSAQQALLDFHKRYPRKPRNARVVGLGQAAFFYIHFHSRCQFTISCTSIITLRGTVFIEFLLPHSFIDLVLVIVHNIL
jgi:hypothetical protein